ncbi:hypothetical protein LMG24235_03525 [Paraburkholderia sabiae]|jgi:hypothetical protein|nr:hypothetical protein LMG24235_03525 [Paraburkholderia sabiae]CAG9198780.1 conserved hypothetical protein [Paraburkholderia sabiae]
MTICTSSSIRTLTVGSGVSPDLLTLHPTYTQALAGSQTRAPDARRLHTAGGEFRPALKTY